MRIVDLTHHVAGPFATLLLAELGHEVIKVERPGSGDPLRSRAANEPGDVAFDYLNRRKRGVTLDLKRRRGRALLKRLVAESDAVIESFRPGTLARLGLSFRSLRRANRDVVLASISNFGQSGPRRDWAASEIVLQATGGIVAASGWANGSPIKLAGNVAQHIGGLNAAIATLAAVLGVRAGLERGVWLDVSIHEAFAAHWARHISQYIHHGLEIVRESPVAGKQGFPHTAQAKDGWLYLLALRAEWESFAHFLGLEDFISHEWSDHEARQARWDELGPAFHAAIASRGRLEWFAAAAERGYTFAPIDGPLGLLASPQLLARGAFVQATLGNGSQAPCPRLPFTGVLAPAAGNRAPRLGEHNAEVYGSLLGVSAEELAALEADGVI
jgi:crotonobetainyl-CoA:carnitine CoA-transferase CaiB-like acyl-CoA transferase